MRIRQVKPEFFADPDMAALPFRCRITYIGLWCVADDAGWFVNDPVQIAGDLYRYDGRKARERWIAEDIAILVSGGFVELPGCRHAVIPTLTRHQRATSGVRRFDKWETEHFTACLRDIPRISAEFRGGTGTGNGTGTERNGSAHGARRSLEDMGVKRP